MANKLYLHQNPWVSFYNFLGVLLLLLLHDKHVAAWPAHVMVMVSDCVCFIIVV